MPAPPARNEISDDYPNPSNAVARVGFGKLWDYITALLGGSGDAEDARVALGVPSAEDADLTGSPTATTAGNGENSTRIATTAWVRSAMSNIASAAGFTISLGSTSSYVKFPSWLGSWLIQFGTVAGTTGGSGNITVTFPVAFVNNRASVASNGDASAGNEPTTIANSSTTGMNVLFVGLGAGAARRANWIAVGN